MTSARIASARSILVIDRNESWSRWAMQVLDRDGYHAMTCSSLQDACRLLTGRRIDLILIGSDIAREGTDVIQRWGYRTQKHVRFLVVFPVRPSYSELRLLWKSGVSDIQVKPYDRRELLAMVSSELDTVGNSHSESRSGARGRACLANC